MKSVHQEGYGLTQPRAPDVFTGTMGNDTYYVDDPADTVIEQPGGGYDTILTSVTYALSPDSHVEALAAFDRLGTELIDLTGNAIANRLFGNAAANRLDGGGGADVMIGYEGDDRYFIDNSQDLVVETAGEGQDAVMISVSYALPWDVEIEGMHAADEFGVQPLNFAGNAFDQTMWGNNGANIFVGGGGNDAFYGRRGHDIYYVDSITDYVFEPDRDGGRDTIFTGVSYALTNGQYVEVLSANDQAATSNLSLSGNTYDNNIFGNAGDNILNGGGGIDILIGYGGDDIYYVDGREDLAYEEDGGGYDTVFTTSSFSLLDSTTFPQSSPTFIEVLAAAERDGVAALTLTGNDLNNVIFGNDGRNTIVGGSGADIMIGYGGNDSYYLDNISDWVEESAGQGADDVVTLGFDFVLPESWHVERVISDGSGITIIGNSLNNYLHGDSGNNVFAGGGGADQMFGFYGDDVYYVEDTTDRPIEGVTATFGNDTVFTGISYALPLFSGIETLSAISQSGTEAINLTGNEQANRLFGNAGSNVLDGGPGGRDILLGYGGSDTFSFTGLLVSDNIDVIFGFDADDFIALSSSVFTNIGPGPLAAAQFTTGAAATESSHRIIYNAETGALLFDADGVGGADAIQFALIDTPLTALSAADFLII